MSNRQPKFDNMCSYMFQFGNFQALLKRYSIYRKITWNKQENNLQKKFRDLIVSHCLSFPIQLCVEGFLALLLLQIQPLGGTNRKWWTGVGKILGQFFFFSVSLQFPYFLWQRLHLLMVPSPTRHPFSVASFGQSPLCFQLIGQPQVFGFLIAGTTASGYFLLQSLLPRRGRGFLLLLIIG